MIAAWIAWFLIQLGLTVLEVELAFAHRWSSSATWVKVLLLCTVSALILPIHVKICEKVGTFVAVVLTGHLFVTTHKRLAALIILEQKRQPMQIENATLCFPLLIRRHFQNGNSRSRITLLNFSRYLSLLVHQGIGILWLFPKESKQAEKNTLKKRQAIKRLSCTSIVCLAALYIFFYKKENKPSVLKAVPGYGIIMYCLLSMPQEALQFIVTNIANVQVLDSFENPLAATSVSEFWKAWNKAAHVPLKASIYQPLKAKQVPPLLCLLSVFFLSGIWHEFICYSAFGIADGSQLLFFLLQMVCISVENAKKTQFTDGSDSESSQKKCLKRFLAVGFLLSSSYIMALPYLQSNAFERLAMWLFG